MIKQYNFPAIFQNVVGDVLPTHLLQKVGQPCQYIRYNLSEEHSHTKSEAQSHPPINPNLFVVKSRKKKLVRRSQFTKTMNFFTFRPRQSKENHPNQSESKKFSNFLKKKQSSDPEPLNNSESCKDQKEHISQVLSQSIENEIEIKFKKYRHSQRNFMRIRTSIDRPLFEDGIIEELQDQILKNDDIRQSTVKTGSQQRFSSFQSLQEKQNKKLRASPGKKDKHRITQAQNSEQVKSQNEMKRTVLFAVASPEAGKIPFRGRQNTMKKGTLFDKKSREKSSKSKMNRILKKVTTDRDSHRSFSTAKSVVSIKFDEKNIVKSKKSLRSNESILNGSDIRLNQKEKVRTRTVKFIHSALEHNVKKYRSEKELGRAIKSVSQHKKKSKFVKSKKSLISQKSIGGSKKKVAFLPAETCPRGLVLRKQESYFLQEGSCAFGDSLRSINTVREARQNRSQKVFKTNIRNSIDNSNVYNELNNFLKFFREGSCFDSEEEVKKTIRKPIVMSDQTYFRKPNTNRLEIETQNLCIDMGLKMARIINQLDQKRI